MNIPSNILTLIAGIAITLVSLWYGQHHGLLPVAASAEAQQVDDIFDFMMTIATGLFFLIQGILVVSLIKFRRRQGDNTDGPPIEGNVPLEILWTAIPTVIVFILSIYSFEVYNAMGGLDPMASMDPGPQQLAQKADNSLVAFNPEQNQVALGLGASPENQGKEAPLTINVQGLQYAWIFTYPDSGIVSGDMHIPLGQEVQLNITATDVLHAFWLPEFRIKQDAIPGREVEMRFTATRLGEYPIICAELCGAYHGGMKTMLYVQSQEDYQQWLQENTIASADNLEQSFATKPANLSDEQFLAPYSEDFGIASDTLEQIHHIK